MNQKNNPEAINAPWWSSYLRSKIRIKIKKWKKKGLFATKICAIEKQTTAYLFWYENVEYYQN